MSWEYVWVCMDVRVCVSVIVHGIVCVLVRLCVIRLAGEDGEWDEVSCGWNGFYPGNRGGE